MTRAALISAASLLAFSGCVTEKKMKTYVDDQVQVVDSRVDDVEGQVEENQTQIADQQKQIEMQQEELAKLSDTSRQALERAVAAGKLAEGKLLYETVLSEDNVRFGFESADLDGSAKTALDSFATDLKARNESVYIEIQGHTDTLGPAKFNFELGEERARAVQQYLHLQHSLPLHRMAVISYGETAPATEGNSRDARSQNRRVVLVVLK
ncbi:MAG: OmpA family protein [Acidobacteriota bacterium]